MNRMQFIVAHFMRQALRLPKAVVEKALSRSNPQSLSHDSVGGEDSVSWKSEVDSFFERAPDDAWKIAYLRRFDSNLAVLRLLIEIHMGQMSAASGRMLTPIDDEFPYLLKQISEPPLALSILGPLLDFGVNRAGLVGSRRASAESLQRAKAMGEWLRTAGWGVVSGGAFGIDVAGQMGWCQAPSSGKHSDAGKSITVFANGLGKLYPQGCSREHNYFKSMGVSFLSENFWFAPALPADFLVRNRLISGLCSMTILVEAQKRSGAMATARLALEQGRDVLVYQHSPKHYHVEGNQSLIDEGAPALLNEQDIALHI